jgi:hypothetical protein
MVSIQNVHVPARFPRLMLQPFEEMENLELLVTSI